ncbi:MAG: hypothetical protein M3167_05280 [Acidobacteriota bacterium]|nr:hypothetical protein [Acidobacteriota bacterium]
MPPTTAPVELPEGNRTAEKPAAEKNEGPRIGAKEQKFVIKLVIPIPA